MHDERRSAAIALRTFVTWRWVLLGLIALGWAGQYMIPATYERIISWFPPAPEPRGTAATLGVLTVLNVITQRWILPTGRASQNLAGAHLIVDATALTVLLALSGGVINSFTAMYFVPITLSTQVSPRWTWALATYCLCAYAVLFLLAPVDHHIAHHNFDNHVRGMWVAFAISGVLITYFVHRIAISLARQRRELARLQSEATQDRHLAAMGTLAAGAAHELGSPLGTIAMLAADIEVMDERERAEASSSIKEAIGRCKHILAQMRSPELRVPTLGRDRRSWPLRELPTEVQGDAEGPVTVLMTEAFAAPGLASDQPREVVGQILRELVANAAEACRRRPGSTGVRVHFDVDTEARTIEIAVQDDGVGMSAEAAEAAFDAFFSTKAEGQGMGLGLYLARAHARQLGGSIDLETEVGEGTTLHLSFPLESAIAEASRR